MKNIFPRFDIKKLFDSPRYKKNGFKKQTFGNE